MKYFLTLLTLGFLFVSCKNDSKKQVETKPKTKSETTKKQHKPSFESNAEGKAIIKETVKAAGGKKYETATITYDFRDEAYKIERNCGEFEFKHTTKNDKGQTVVDRLDNTGFTRFVDKRQKNLADTTANNLRNSLNSVNYFVELPFGLNANAVHKKYLGDEEINGETYSKIKVAFSQEGGGEDHEDIYMYWIDPKQKTIAYFAYSFEVNGGGMRFRKAHNPRTVGGIRFVDYENYAPKEKGSVAIEDVGKAFENDKLKKVSDVEINNVKVSIRDRNCG